ncbi:uncharacterized protein MELLADRAFT_113522 [Melampsora larici-populina 98AG31]|uniref:Uncharacterized protein n=1 Tax=Melampsora larici-populina (strain 98AG31 / pathotype 3-4-7) TaxID=747676 RepID=F4SA64_MELLP|nr:uncharacterized protein MELLADRAFT_113522 [Melampsora larici-populina 98AG31]EGF98462.1 hypothetical protein MELLADRAFT_113522 [Melampsora larici-populina 98AG31]
MPASRRTTRRKKSASPETDSSAGYAPPTNTAGPRRKTNHNIDTFSQATDPPRTKKRRRTDDEHPLETTHTEDDKHPTTSSTSPNMSNYCQLGNEWGMPRAERNLAQLDLPKNNRISAIGLYEAQALQVSYELDKTMLCIVLKCSRKVLDDALLKGPLSREPNMYTNYQTYSNVATKTPIKILNISMKQVAYVDRTVPPKGVSQGFPERNTIVGNTWSNYDKDEHKVFTPRLFERLCIGTSKAYALTSTPLGIPASTKTTTAGLEPTPLGIPPSAKTTTAGLEPLTQEECEKYIPIFERLVNLTKVSHDLHDGRLWRHSGKSKNHTSEQLLNQEISKAVRQFHLLNSHFNLQYHLLVARWNPASTGSNALFQDEFTTCERWARSEQKTHLLERFTFESTKAPQHLRTTRKEPKPMSEAAARQANRRAELAKALNELMGPHLRGGYQGKGDAHPKVADLKKVFETKEFRGGVKLTFNRTPESSITDMMLWKGPSALSNDEVDIWIQDIKMKYYTINRAEPESSRDSEKKLGEAQDKSDNDRPIGTIPNLDEAAHNLDDCSTPIIGTIPKLDEAAQNLDDRSPPIL